jgi:EAL domain-containing protein (putative c-di-GMP-specific phosphodiesterase class I)
MIAADGQTPRSRSREAVGTTTPVQGEFERIVRERRLRSVFQPVVSLEQHAVVGYEALIRGPAGSPLAAADALLAAAYDSGRAVEFDWVARASACRAALKAGLSPHALLFVNIEPLALDSDCPPDLWPDIEKAFGAFRIVLEVTERSLDHDPGALLDGLRRHRPSIAGFALDDVGSDAATLALLPIVAPAVIKIDRQVTQAGPTPTTARVFDVVGEEAERTGAIVLCEGIETDVDLAAARSLGAGLGQGYHFGRPGPLNRHADELAPAPVTLRADTPQTIARPFHALHGRITGRCDARLLAAFTEHVESYAGAAAGLLIEHYPQARHFGAVEQHRLAGLTQAGAMTAVLGPGIATRPGLGIRGAAPQQASDLTGEWAAVALTPSAGVALLARTVDDRQSQFDYGITHNRNDVIAAARCLLQRFGPVPVDA